MLRGRLASSSRNQHATVQTRQFAKVSALSLNAKKRKGKKITMVTAYDFPSAIHVARAGIDIVLVGDSVAMVELGHETTQQMTVGTMIHHCQSVKRGLESVDSGSLLVGDMPFGTYEFEDTDVALRHAYQFVKEGGCDAVKLEVRDCQTSANPRLFCNDHLSHVFGISGWKPSKSKNRSKNRRRRWYVIGYNVIFNRDERCTIGTN
jgi:ketopantoate hydroxymethyltransferase